MVYNIRTIGNNINKDGLTELSADRFAIDKVAEAAADAFIVRSQDFHDYQFPKQLLAVARSGVGFNNLPIERCASEGIVVFNTPGANANAVKELVLGTMLLANRNYRAAGDWLESLSGNDSEIDVAAEKGKKNFAGTEIFGKTLGVIGMGNIGSRVANDAQRLGMKVLGYDPYMSMERAWDISHEVTRVSALTEIFEQSDYITIHTPLTEETRGIFNRENFAKMKKGVVLIDFARDEVTEKEAVLEFIGNGTIKAFFTDFGSEKYFNNPQIFVSPHIGGSTREAELNCVRMAAMSLDRFLTTGEVVNSVNFPRVIQPLTAPYRITLINKNVPGVVGRISAVVSDEGINITNIVNRAQGDFAYTLLDLDEQDEKKVEALVKHFEESDAIVRTRVIKNNG